MAQNKSEEQGPRGDTTSGRHLCPAFVLNMTCALSDYDITFEPSKTLVEFKVGSAILLQFSIEKPKTTSGKSCNSEIANPEMVLLL